MPDKTKTRRGVHTLADAQRAAITAPDRHRPLDLGAGLFTLARGQRDADGRVLVELDGAPLRPRPDIARYWTSRRDNRYDAGTPAAYFGRLALARDLLAATIGDDFARDHHRDFAARYLAQLPRDRWTITASDLALYRMPRRYAADF